MTFTFDRLRLITKKSIFIECLISLILFALALAIRLPNLMEVPYYTDEGAEVLWGLDIALGKHLPLTAVDAYDGPLFPYLIALLFRLFGLSVQLPRLTIAVVGAFTVVATYVLGRVMLERTIGLISAGMAMTSPVLVVFQSHYGWSSGLTPLLVTLTALTLYVGVTRRHYTLLTLSGLCAAMTLQAHPTTAVALLGMVFWFFLQPNWRSWLKRPAPYWALLLFLAGYSPMLVANAGANSTMVQVASERLYAFVPTLDPFEYLRRLSVLFRIGGYFFSRGMGDPTFVLRVQAVAAEILLVVAFVWAWRQRHWLIPVTCLTTIFLLLFFVSSDSYRYYFYIIPMLYILLAGFLVAIFRALALKIMNANSQRLAQIVTGGLLGAFILYPLVTISDFYRHEFAHDLTNNGYFELVQTLHAQGACGPRLFIQDRFVPSVPSSLSTFDLNAVDYVSTLDRCEHMMASRSAFVQKLSAFGSGWFIIPSEIAPFFDGFSLQLLQTVSSAHFNSIVVPISLYRVEPKK